MTTTTDPTTPAPELTALGDDELIARYELVRDEMGVMTGPAFVSAQANYKDLRAELKRRLAAAERPAEGDTVCPDCQARRSETDIPCFVHRSATMPSGSVMISAEDARHAMNAIEELWSEGIGGYTRLHKRLSRVAAAERPAEGTVVISANDARFIDSFMCSELHLHPEWDATYRAEVDAVWRRVMSVVDAPAASSAPADAALGQGEGTE